ncbi:diaminopimelate epimerase [Limibacillus halophilus]|uniref:Diaminopimelate epimerase n=1 Tax=Limibacillus halophilus TaxID=1579333 RepID=A0A839SW11_9PROT|nr:diaminopimelate epimerase [Limibacillus halophilus]MBB3066478.1 diaminopimelate epimerase [Limibacillus halophilus]
MTGRPFIKMHGLGNDFVIIDARKEPFEPTPAQARAIADRHRGVGCDQLIVLEPPRDRAADLYMRILNADASPSGACGNATRCVGLLLARETGRPDSVIETDAGLLRAEAASPERVTVDMGPARLGWRDIPLAEERDTLNLGIAEGPLSDPVGVSMGNPHAVFIVEDGIETLPITVVGPKLEIHPLFPERANIGVMQAVGPDRLRLRVWERGAGLTLACGSGACAAMVAAVRRGLTGRRATLLLDGGTLEMEWREADGHVLMTGPTATAFAGTLDPALLAADDKAIKGAAE